MLLRSVNNVTCPSIRYRLAQQGIKDPSRSSWETNLDQDIDEELQ